MPGWAAISPDLSQSPPERGRRIQISAASVTKLRRTGLRDGSHSNWAIGDFRPFDVNCSRVGWGPAVVRFRTLLAIACSSAFLLCFCFQFWIVCFFPLVCVLSGRSALSSRGPYEDGRLPFADEAPRAPEPLGNPGFSFGLSSLRCKSPRGHGSEFQIVIGPARRLLGRSILPSSQNWPGRRLFKIPVLIRQTASIFRSKSPSWLADAATRFRFSAWPSRQERWDRQLGSLAPTGQKGQARIVTERRSPTGSLSSFKKVTSHFAFDTPASSL